MIYKTIIFFFGIVLLSSCAGKPQKEQSSANDTIDISDRIPVLFDTDANNELDDQHALAYLLFNGETFNVRGVTVNATFSGGEIEEHYREAERILQTVRPPIVA